MEEKIKFLKERLGLEGLVLTKPATFESACGFVANPRTIKTKGLGWGLFGRFVGYYEEAPVQYPTIDGPSFDGVKVAVPEYFPFLLKVFGEANVRFNTRTCLIRYDINSILD